jgi:hypothetical protein
MHLPSESWHSGSIRGSIYASRFPRHRDAHCRGSPPHVLSRGVCALRTSRSGPAPDAGRAERDGTNLSMGEIASTRRQFETADGFVGPCEMLIAVESNNGSENHTSLLMLARRQNHHRLAWETFHIHCNEPILYRGCQKERLRS